MEDVAGRESHYKRRAAEEVPGMTVGVFEARDTMLVAKLRRLPPELRVPV